MQVINKLIKSSQIFSSLESRNYRFYFAGQSISLIGSWMQTIAMSWLVYRLTGSIFLLGLIGFTSQIPNFLLSPLAGVITDRFDRKQIMLLTQILFMIQAFMLAFLVLFDLVQIWHVVILSLIFGIISAFDVPSRQSLVVDLIDKPDNLSNAIALNSAVFNGARLFGPAIAGMVIAIVGEGICFLINALSYVSIIVALYKIYIPKKVKLKARENFKTELVDGFRYTFGFKPIKTLLILLAILSLVALPFSTLMPAYASEILKGSSYTYGFLMSASGAGALLGAIYLASRNKVIGLGKVIAFNAVLFGLAILGISITNSAGISVVVLFFTGFCMITTIASINTLVQTLSEENKRGRVMSFYAVALLGMHPIGNLFAGILASALGISFTLLFSGLITCLVGIWFMMNWPKLEKIFPITVPVIKVDANH